MSYIDDSTNITNLVIPGTHNSCSSKFIKTNLKFIKERIVNQVWSIREQLLAGIRYFDLRPGQNYYIYHSNFPTIYTLNDTLKEMSNFLKEYPSEFLFVRFQFVNKTCQSINYFLCFDKFLHSVLSEYYDIFYQENEFPELKSIRGKIYPFIENSDFANFTNWNSFKEGFFYLQDIYKYKLMHYLFRPFLFKSKRDSIKLYLYDIDRKKEKLVLNHNSMTNRNLKCTPQFVAFITNEISFKSEYIRGVVIFDFPSEELIKHIIDKNNLNWDL
jgi:1-phosphatidylinositol phosphodiesterase